YKFREICNFRTKYFGFKNRKDSIKQHVVYKLCEVFNTCFAILKSLGNRISYSIFSKSTPDKIIPLLFRIFNEVFRFLKVLFSFG
ncbi:MAG: hypothetical protein UW98_C0012G0012, partial [Parcubacteria group bacterium GW2011_GWC2_45_15]